MESMMAQRKAGRPAAELHEIKVTSEMIEAGRAAYCRNARFEGDADSDVMVYAVFRDMVRASPQLRRYRVSSD
jgi:hypothetical protein